MAGEQKEEEHDKGFHVPMPAWFYDSIVFVFTLGRESRQRKEILDIAMIQPNERVLDVGCGTGTLAIMAADDSGARRIVGVDPDPKMIQRASKKAGENRTNLHFSVGECQSLKMDDASFELILTTFTLHHMPGGETQRKCLSEMKRVLVPGGRLLLVDFAGGHGHHHHVNPCQLFCGAHENENASNDPMVGLLEQAGFENVSAQSIRMLGAVAVLAYNP